MYKLPQLPHDQFAAFVCALFEQIMFVEKENDFEITDNLIESEKYELFILTVPLSIELVGKDALVELKRNVNNLLSSKNKITNTTLIIATNYALKLPFQEYLNSLQLDIKCLYLDWEGISILADNANTKLPQFYPNLDFKDLPYNFQNQESKLKYYREGVYLTSMFFDKSSIQTSFFRIRLANEYEKQDLFLEALREHKINAEIIAPLANEKINTAVELFIRQTYSKIGTLYYKLSDYSKGVKWYKDLLSVLENYYEDKANDDFLSIVIGVMRGHWASGGYNEAYDVFRKIEYILSESMLGTSEGLELATSQGTNLAISKNSNISITIQIVLYSFGTRIYDIKGFEEKALMYFEKTWNILESEQNQTIIEKSTNVTQQVLKEAYPQYYKKLENQNHLIRTTLSHNLPTTDIQFPFAIKQVHIKAFQSIKDLKIDTIPVNAQWIFITGKNGSGKSSILKAITAGIVGDVVQEHIRPSTEQNAIISIELLQDNTNQIQTLKSEDRRWELYKDKELEVRDIPLLAYGVSRLNIQTEGSEDRRYKDDHVFSLFKSDEGNLSNVEEWLKDEMLKILKANDKDRIKIEQRYNMVKDTLSQLMPSVSQVDYNDKEAHIEYTENGEVVKMERLASGNKSILAMVGDILIRLLRFYPNVDDTTNFKGIIIIDELDLHLHPSWQREMPWLLSHLFPKVQFICSTHSIIPFMGAPKNSVFFTVDRTEEEGTTIQKLDIDVSSLSANILLSSPLFEVSLLSKVAEAEGKRQEYRTESNYEEYDENVKNSAAFKKMQEKYGDILGDKLFKK